MQTSRLLACVGFDCSGGNLILGVMLLLRAQEPGRVAEANNGLILQGDLNRWEENARQGGGQVRQHLLSYAACNPAATAAALQTALPRDQQR